VDQEIAGAETIAAVMARGNKSMPRVLLIEDDKETADEIRAELGDRGFDVDWAANGMEGLDKARSGNAEAMIIDRLLPGMDGLTIIEALRREGMRTPVLVFSALGAVDDRVRGLRAGGDDYLTKPFATVELTARIEALLRRPAESPDTVLRVGPLELDLIERAPRRRHSAIAAQPWTTRPGPVSRTKATATRWAVRADETRGSRKRPAARPTVTEITLTPLNLSSEEHR